MRMTTAQRNILITMGVVSACCLLPLLGGLVYYLLGPQITPGRPLVMIHQPTSGQRVPMGRAVAVHSTARDEKKVTHIELWADGQLQHRQASPRTGGISPMTLMQGWQPTTAGFHTLVVRAFNRSGGDGQASTVVEVVTEPTEEPTTEPGETATPEPTLPPGCEEPVGAYLAQEGDTLESIATTLGVTVEQIQICNPDLGADPLAAGTVVLVPISEEPEPTGEPTGEPTEEPTAEPTEEPPEAPPGGETPPDPEGDPPPDIIPDLPEPEPPTTDLEFEALVLEVEGVYDGVYCFGALGPADFERIPPGHDSFASSGERRWNIADYAAGAQRRTFPWLPEEPLRVAAECMGIESGNPLALGNFENFHGSEEWDGRRLVGTGTGTEGWFQMEYHINYAGADGGLPPPTNLHTETLGLLHQLRWDWPGDEGTIDGFRLYLNDSLQWAVTNPGARSTGLPAAWLDPPCDDTYRFHVTAFQGPLGVGIESISSDPVVIEGLPCDEVWRVTFDQMHFTCLRADIAGFCPPPGGWLAGPIYGNFWANTKSVMFDSGAPGVSLWPMTLLPYSVLDVFFAPVCDDCPAHSSVVVPQEVGGLAIGAQVWEVDPPGAAPAAPVCADMVLIDPVVEGDGVVVCDTPWGMGTVHYIIGSDVPGAGGVSVGPGLPDLAVLNTWNNMAGQMHVRVQNAGTVPLAGWDLDVRLERASTSENLGTFTFSGFTLEPSEATTLTRPEWVLGDPTDIIVTLDPNNVLPEANEDNNTYGGADRLILGMILPLSPAHARTFQIHYQYHSDHGDDVQVRVTPLYLSAPVADLPAVSVTIPHGDSVAPVHIIYGGAERAYTDQLRLEIVDMVGIAFHSVTIDDIRLIWDP
ncbi:MAG: LysM peptidoglycan-binding domain-containing protein [Anaerolineae bacterium]